MGAAPAVVRPSWKEPWRVLREVVGLPLHALGSREGGAPEPAARADAEG